MLIIVKANEAHELEQLVDEEKLPDGTYIELDDSGGSLSYALFQSEDGKRLEIDTTLSPVNAINEHNVQFILVTAKYVEADVFAGGLMLGNVDCIVYTVDEFLTSQNRQPN